MEAKLKAKEIIEKIQFGVKDSESSGGGHLMFINEAKECAVIFVDLILDSNNLMFNKDYLIEVKEAIISYENE